MSHIQTTILKNSTIMLLFSERDEIQVDPEYQRKGGVWNKEKKQLLIDSILNDYDIPKIYFHDLPETQNNQYDYSVIDGRQRLETIWQFMSDEFVVGEDFIYQKDPSIKLAGLSYSDLAIEHPKVRIRFDSFNLPVVLVQTSDGDIDLIEDMFSRLNEAATLNSAEKRNAIGGKLVKAIRTLGEHDFFSERVKFGNTRYQHREVAARILLIEKCLQQSPRRLIDTKKTYLDNLARKHKTANTSLTNTILANSQATLDAMKKVFAKKDPLLSSQGNMTVYYLLFSEALENGTVSKLSRRGFQDFNDLLKENRRFAEEEDYESATFELLEYDRLTQQGTNDANNIKERYRVLARHFGLSGDLVE